MAHELVIGLGSAYVFRVATRNTSEGRRDYDSVHRRGPLHAWELSKVVPFNEYRAAITDMLQKHPYSRPTGDELAERRRSAACIPLLQADEG